jgi:colanic acid biosynthesis protein WcaH
MGASVASGLSREGVDELGQQMNDMNRAIGDLESLVSAPERGLPEELLLLVSRLTPLVNVDLLIQDSGGRTLLTWRHDRFYGPGWHIPGGIIRYKEKAMDRIHAVGRQELVAEVEPEAAPLLVREYIDLHAIERGHHISLLYRCRLLTPPDPARRFVLQDPQPDQWKWHEHCPPNLIAQQLEYATYFK